MGEQSITQLFWHNSLTHGQQKFRIIFLITKFRINAAGSECKGAHHDGHFWEATNTGGR
jgi:hypothetical protein